MNQEIIELPVIEFLKHEKGFNETVVDNIKLPANLVIGKDNFISKVSDNSLIEAGVLKDDYIIVDRCNVAKNGSIIIGIINNNKLILARYFKNEKDIELKFQDESNDIEFLSKNTFKLIGKIKGNFRVIK
ncbi:S24 family peptidase (plasmid) [Paraclostridium bifermentans]|uniref:S24 family peptidase n=1 Tax=Paraclostridium bifermentans TaxID=1490 RepID=A0ABY8RA36_PARBF|nr:S24 family peptidase [Paraclostridium bifermentans]